jgi:hypothetical protein
MNGTFQSPAPQPAAAYIPPAVGRNNRTTAPAVAQLPGAPLQVINIILPHGANSTPGYADYPQPGNSIYVISSNGPIHIKQENGVFLPMLAGQSLKLSGGAHFKTVSVKNPSTTATLTATIVVGYDDFKNPAQPSQLVTPSEGLTLIASTNVAQPLSTTDIYFTQGFFYGYSALVNGTPTNNNANVAIGKSAKYQPDLIGPGQVDFPISANPGRMFNLANIYIIGTQNDGIFWTITL